MNLGLLGLVCLAPCVVWADLKTGLAGSWDFERADSLTIPDASAKSNDLTPYRCTRANWIAGKPGLGRAMVFDSVSRNGARSNANNLYDGFQSGTVSFWFRTTKENAVLLCYASPETSNSAMSWGLDSGYVAQSWKSKDGLRHNLRGASHASDGQWHFVCFVANGTSQLRIYLDDTQQPVDYIRPAGAGDRRTDFIADLPNLQRNHLVQMGSWPQRSANGSIVEQGLYSGLIDEVSIWSRPLSASEIWSLYGVANVAEPVAAPIRPAQPAVPAAFPIVDTTAPVVAMAPLQENDKKEIGPGSKVKIEWSAQDAFGVASCSLYYGANPVWNLIAALPGTSTRLDWQAPADLSNGSCIKIVVRDSAGNSAAAFSTPFSVAGVPHVTSPDSVVVKPGDALYYILTYDSAGVKGRPEFAMLGKPTWDVMLLGSSLIGGPAPRGPQTDTIRIKFSLGNQKEFFSLRVLIPTPSVALRPVSVSTTPVLRLVGPSTGVDLPFPMDSRADYRLDIYDCTGRKLWSYKGAGADSEIQVRCPSLLLNGAYIATLKSAEKSTRRSFRVLR